MWYVRVKYSVRVHVKVRTVHLILRLVVKYHCRLAPRYGTCSQLRDLSFYLHPHTFICNRNEPYLPLPSQLLLVAWYSVTDPVGMEGWVGLGGWLRNLPARKQSPIPLLTGLNVEQLRWSRPVCYHYTKPPSVSQCFSLTSPIVHCYNQYDKPKNKSTKCCCIRTRGTLCIIQDHIRCLCVYSNLIYNR